MKRALAAPDETAGQKRGCAGNGVAPPTVAVLPDRLLRTLRPFAPAAVAGDRRRRADEDDGAEWLTPGCRVLGMLCTHDHVVLCRVAKAWRKGACAISVSYLLSQFLATRRMPRVLAHAPT